MRYFNDVGCRRQFENLRCQFLQGGELAFSSVLSEEIMADSLSRIQDSRDRVYTPLVTLWVFLGQVLCTDHSCRAAVARWMAHRTAHGQAPCSSRTGAYCQARKRLPEEFVRELARSSGKVLSQNAVSK